MPEPSPLADWEKELLREEQSRAHRRARFGLGGPGALTREQWRQRFAADRAAEGVEPDPATWLHNFLDLSEVDQLDSVEAILSSMKVVAECYQQDHAGLRRQLEKTEIQRDEAIRNGGGIGHPPQECGDPSSCPQHMAQYLHYQMEGNVETIKALEECVALQARALQGKAHTAELGRAITRAESAEAEVRMLRSKVRFYEDGRKKLNLPVGPPDGTACLLDLGDDPDDHASHPHARV